MPEKLSLSIAAAGGVQASTVTRTLAGELVRFDVLGRTSRGPLRVRAGALRFPDDIARVKLTREHNRDESRGHCTGIEVTPEGIRAAFKVADGPEGDAALREAADGTRDAFSFDVVDATVVGDEITDALVIATGQVGIPAYDNSRIDTIAANNPRKVHMMLSPDQAQLLVELQALEAPSEEQTEALKALEALAAAPDLKPTAAEAPAAPATAAVAASASTPVAATVPAVQAGIPRAATTTRPAGGALRKMITDLTAAMQPEKRSAAAITAALSDIVHSDHTADIEPVAWSGELWSGLQYQPVFSDLLNRGPLTNWHGRGWRFTSTLAIQDYTGNKDDIPSDTVTTEDSVYEAARAAVGVDADRKFYDFPNEGFITALVEQVRESWEILVDAKCRAFITTNAVAGTRTLSIGKTNADATITSNGGFRASDVGATITGSGIPASTTIASVTNADSAEMSAVATNGTTVTATIGAQEGTLLKAAARAGQVLTTRRVGKPDWFVVNDEDMFSLLDTTEAQLPAFLDLWGIDPGMFRSSPDVAAGTLLAGVKNVGVLRTLPGSPIRVSAQHLAQGGVDEAFFGYWAIEEHHTSGIASVVFNPPAA